MAQPAPGARGLLVAALLLILQPLALARAGCGTERASGSGEARTSAAATPQQRGTVAGPSTASPRRRTEGTSGSPVRSPVSSTPGTPAAAPRGGAEPGACCTAPAAPAPCCCSGAEEASTPERGGVRGERGTAGRGCDCSLAPADGESPAPPAAAPSAASTAERAASDALRAGSTPAGPMAAGAIATFPGARHAAGTAGSGVGSRRSDPRERAPAHARGGVELLTLHAVARL